MVLTLQATHKDICDPHLQHTILFGKSPTSLKSWTPKSSSLNKNATNNLFGASLAPSVAQPYVVDGTCGLEKYVAGN